MQTAPFMTRGHGLVLATCGLLGLAVLPSMALAVGNFNFQEGVDDGPGVYTGTSDAAIDAADPTTNFATEPLDFVDGAPDFEHLLIHFANVVGTGSGQMPLGSYVHSAELILETGSGAAASASPHALHRLLQGWDEASITWMNSFGADGVDANDLESTSTVLAAIPPTAADSTIVLDIRSAAEAWASGVPNHGVVLLPGGTDGLGIRLSEDPTPALRPRLEILAFPDGTASFADEVESFNLSLANGGPDPGFIDPLTALGVPDFPDPPGCTLGGCGSVSLGSGGDLTVRFTDNVLTGSGDSALDLWIFEVGSEVEDTFVEISNDAVTWVSVGKVFGATSGIDLDAFGFGASDVFHYVRLTDDPNEGSTSGESVGADIDGVGAISSLPIVAADWSDALAFQADDGSVLPALLLGMGSQVAAPAVTMPDTTTLVLTYSGLDPNANVQLNLASFITPFYPPDPVHVISPSRVEVEMDQNGTMFTLGIDFSSTTGDQIDPGSLVGFNPQPEPPDPSRYGFDPQSLPLGLPEGLGAFMTFSGGAGAPGSTSLTLTVEVLDATLTPLPLTLVGPAAPTLGVWSAAAAVVGLLATGFVLARRETVPNTG